MQQDFAVPPAGEQRGPVGARQPAERAHKVGVRREFADRRQRVGHVEQCDAAVVGTGGDDAGTVNISTGSCILAAAAGAKVAKHGNRSVSSMCGSADVLEALGVAVDLGPEGVAECIKQTNMGFMFAPRYHPAMKAVVPVRKVSLF